MGQKGYFKFLYLLIFVFMGAALGVYAGLGCDTAGSQLPIPVIPAPSPTPGPIPTPNVDVVAGGLTTSKVFIWYDSNNLPPAPPPTPAVSLDADFPLDLEVVNNILVVLNVGGVSGFIDMYADFLGLTTGDSPDQTQISGIDTPQDMATAPGLNSHDLYVANNSFPGSVTIYRDIETIVANGVDVAPDVTIGPPSGLTNAIFAVTVANNTLYVCNHEGEDLSTVLIFHNADSLVGTDPTPDEVLDGFTGLSGIFGCLRLRVFNNALYVVNFGENVMPDIFTSVSAFSPADNLVSNQPPDFELLGGTEFNSGVSLALDVNVPNQNLFVARRFSAAASPDTMGIVGFAPPFVDNQSPDVILNKPISHCRRMASANNTLYVTCNLGLVDGITPQGVYGFTDPDSLVNGDLPDIFLTTEDPLGDSENFIPVFVQDR